MMQTIPLTQGYRALVSDKDYWRVSQYKWCAHVHKRKDGTIKSVYAVRQVDEHHSQRMHRFILRVYDPKIKVDHENHDGLDNQRHNLRKATHSQNNWNMRKHTRNTSGFKGVSWSGNDTSKRKTRWYARLSVNGKTLHLGHFTTAVEAAQAYDKAARKHFGRFALTNF